MCNFVSHNLAGFVNCVRTRRIGVEHFYPFAVYEDAAALMKVKIESSHTSMMGNIRAFVPNMYQRSGNSPESHF